MKPWEQFISAFGEPVELLTLLFIGLKLTGHGASFVLKAVERDDFLGYALRALKECDADGTCAYAILSQECKIRGLV